MPLVGSPAYYKARNRIYFELKHVPHLFFDSCVTITKGCVLPPPLFVSGRIFNSGYRIRSMTRSVIQLFLLFYFFFMERGSLNEFTKPRRKEKNKKQNTVYI